MSKKKKILWADDEIDRLKSHIYLLESKGYEVTPVSNGDDAITLVEKTNFDLVMLDEMMPGKDGLSTLEEIKQKRPNLPVIMITKSEAEDLMEEAIGKQIDDYLTKPVNPSQILSTIKKILYRSTLRRTQISRDYVTEFNSIMQQKSGIMDWQDWIDLHLKLSQWGIELETYGDEGLRESHSTLKEECELEFSHYMRNIYPEWVMKKDAPPLSSDIVSKFVLPHLTNKGQVYLIIIDCLRLDQWLALEPLLTEFFDIERKYYYSILPTATPYSRNAIFAGLLPIGIKKHYPQYWKEEASGDHTKNRFERQLLEGQLKRLKVELKTPPKYVKVFTAAESKSLKSRLGSFYSVPLVTFVFNFIDILTHGRSESEILKAITPDEAGFRTLTKSWFLHSGLYGILKQLSRRPNCTVVLSTDHGFVSGKHATKAFGNKDTSTNLRYKYGQNLGCEPRNALHIKKPILYGLPDDMLGKQYIIATQNYYFVYPTNFHHYQRQYEGTFQHGGISMDEMILPCVIMKSKA